VRKWKVSFISLVALIVLPWNGAMLLASDADAAAEKKHKDKYVELVVSILRSHVIALRDLTANEIKYSDNVARHAIGIKQTWDMLGPMDWHALEAKRLQKKKEGGNAIILQQKDFDKMVDNSLTRVDRLRQSAHRWIRDNDRDAFMKDLDSMMQSCKDCHSLMPKNTAPAVWKGLKGKL